MTERFVLYGAGALAREIVDVIVRLRGAGADVEFLGALVDPDYEAPEAFHGKPVHRNIDAFKGDDSLRFVVALGDPTSRAGAVGRLESALGARFASVIDPSVLIGTGSSVGAGTVILGHASITTDTHLGGHVLVNPGCTIAHDNRVADFATLSPGVHLAGHVTVDDSVFLGIGACVIPQIRIGAGAFVGAGSIVIRNVAPGHTVLGNPARVLRRG